MRHDGSKQSKLKSDYIKLLTVDGREFGIFFPDGSTVYQEYGGYSTYMLQDLNFIQSGSLWYVFVEGAREEAEYVFYQGEKTPVADMSKLKGKVDYTGQALQYGELGGDGTANFTANFDNKTIAGTISNSKTTVKLTADIKGNTFVNDGSKTGVQVDGAFFGNNAEELSGIYMGKNKDFAGAFGAKKQ